MSIEEPSFHTITRDARVIGYIAIDSTVGGSARGGLRIVNDLCEAEIRAAARAMTLKYGILGLPQGGAKAGIIGDGEAAPGEKRRLLHEFALAAAPFLRTRAYVPDADLGTSAPEIRSMMQSIGMRVGRREWRANRSGEYAARSCLAAARALAARQGASLSGCHAAVEGFGKVGSALALLLVERGAKVVALSTVRGALYRAEGLDVARLARRAAEIGSGFVEDEPDRIEREALLELPVDFLFPCARFHSICGANVRRVSARAICAGANDPVSPEAEMVLLDRGLLYPPDFLSNCGGVLGGTLEFAGVSPDRIGTIVEDWVQRRVASVMGRAERQGVTPRSVAEAEALARHVDTRRRTENPGVLQRLLSLGVEGYRRGWIPARLMSLGAPWYLARRSA